MSGEMYFSKTEGALTVCAYPGDGTVLLAFDLDKNATPDFAGFAIRFTPKGGKPTYIPNRLSFDTKYSDQTTAEDRTWTPSNLAPIQQFRWTHVLPDADQAPVKYEVTAMYFAGGAGKLREGDKVSVEVDMLEMPFSGFQVGFTRGYLSSQAYADLFQNAPIRPAQKSITYDTKPYAKQYAWLGFHARNLVFDFIDECVKDKSVTVDFLGYDLDEPDFIAGLTKLGTRLRAFLDNCPLHTKSGAMEPLARAAIEKSAGAQNVRVGHFQRFAHCKILIQRRNGTPVKVLTGSANFSVRGLYVQANNVLVIEDAQTAGLYGRMFDETFNSMGAFKSSPIAAQWFDLPGGSKMPRLSVCFSPHQTASVSLDRVAQAIRNAKSSVLFAVMQLGGGGPVMDALRTLNQQEIFSYGVTQNEQGINVHRGSQDHGVLVPFGFLGKNVPAPFREEWNGGMGQVIHDKFVVVDYNDDNPVVFTGSSNLAAGGEEQNGDNLLAIYDRDVAYAFGVEAIRLVDHYHFRAAMKSATKSAPLCLSTQEWWSAFYQSGDLRCVERELFAREGGASATGAPGKVVPFPKKKKAAKKAA